AEELSAGGGGGVSDDMGGSLQGTRPRDSARRSPDVARARVVGRAAAPSGRAPPRLSPKPPTRRGCRRVGAPDILAAKEALTAFRLDRALPLHHSRRESSSASHRRSPDRASARSRRRLTKAP